VRSQVLEGVIEGLRRRRLGVSEADVVKRNEMKLVSEGRDQVGLASEKWRVFFMKEDLDDEAEAANEGI
jgi:hypothetical protein